MTISARLAAPLFPNYPTSQAQLEPYSWNQLHWSAGRNPVDVCMLTGTGYGRTPYMFFRSYKYTNTLGSITNGITAAFNNKDGIAFEQGYAVTEKDDDWRWTEQWLPHAAWYLDALSFPHTP